MDEADKSKIKHLISKFNQEDGDGPRSPTVSRQTSKTDKHGCNVLRAFFEALIYHSDGSTNLLVIQRFQKYNSLKIFNAPVQLIYEDESKRIRYNDEAISELHKVDHDVNVIAIVGLYRTGKSLLLNRLAGKDNAFDIGHTCNAKTLGVWMMCLPHPTQESQVLVLLDTEGLCAVLEDKLLEDRWHFLLATLLSSTLVYNHKGVLDSDAIQKLTLEGIKTSLSVMGSESNEDAFFDVFFPSFVMVIRDNILEVTDAANNPITFDEYLENALTLKDGCTKSVHQYNRPRLLIRRYFKHRKCFMFSPPIYQKELQVSCRSSFKNAEFENDVKALTEFIYGCEPKRMVSGKTLNGRMFGSLVRSYVRFIQEGKPACMHTAVKEMIEYENQNLIAAAEKVYKAEMQQLMGSSLPGTQTITQFHLQSTDKAIKYLRRVIIYDDVELFFGTAMDAFNQALDRLIKSVTKDSETICWGRLNYLDSTRIQKKIKNEAYKHVSGYDEYIKDIDWVIKQYRGTIGLGPKKMHVLQSYLGGKEAEEENIYGLVKRTQEEKLVNTSSKAKIDRKELRSMYENLNDCNGNNTLEKDVEDDQRMQQRQITMRFTKFGDMKDKELLRQKQENPTIASQTKEENEQYREKFLAGLSFSYKDLPVRDSGIDSSEDDREQTKPKQKSCKIM